ncbi:MAG: MBL fold metallo-hydrolase [Deltaproteobacteria bacterium]|nr:MBL fold metallo-hydrolase [Deltaproteobacteria bacterium]
MSYLKNPRASAGGFFISALLLCLIHCGGSLNLKSDQSYDSSPSIDEPETISGILTIIAIDVGQGDATLLITPSGQTILIDGGGIEDGIEDILPLFSHLGVTHLDYLFVSHYDADHIGGIYEVVAGNDGELETKDDILPSITYDNSGTPSDASVVFDHYATAVASSRQTLLPGDEIDIGDGVVIDCLINNGVTADGRSLPVEDDDNGASMGLLITYGDFQYFTAGDLPGGGQSGAETTVDAEGLVAPLVGEVDLLHVNHHGSKTSSSEYFLETLRPTISIISVGDNNTYGHPHSEVLSRLSAIGTEIYQTEAGAGGLLPEAHIIDDSIFIYVEANGGYTVNGDPYESKRSNSN